jgi:hypothetical protein
VRRILGRLTTGVTAEWGMHVIIRRQRHRHCIPHSNAQEEKNDFGLVDGPVPATLQA